MKKATLLFFGLIFSLTLAAQAPANDCGENATLINTCGAAFSITQAQMGLATEDGGCSVGGSCPINYVNGQAYENFDCNATGGAGGDDFSGSIENSVWWTFTPLESCDYVVTIAISNCCCKDKGSTNAAQYQIFDADAPLPGGTIQNGTMAYATGVVGTFTETISVTNGNPVYILLDGLNGTDCDISVTITPTASCSGCIIALPIELIAFDGEYNNGDVDLFWASASESNNSHYLVERSIDGYEWNFVCTVDGAGTTSQPMTYRTTDRYVPKVKNIYYRLSQVDFDGNSETFKTIPVHTPYIKDPKVVARYDMQGRELTEEQILEYKGLYIEKYEDGTAKKICRE